MKEKQNKYMGLRVVTVVLIGLILLPMSSAQDPPSSSSSQDEKDCLFYAYSVSQSHYFLIQNNSSLFGSEINIIHNCDNVLLIVDGFNYASSNESFKVKIDPGIRNITIQSEDKKEIYESVLFYPDVLLWESEYEYLMNPNIDKEFIDVDVAQLKENWAVAFGIIIVWGLSTLVYWKLIQSYVDKNFIEEVVQ
jgi:hypothetical protein